MLSQVSADDDPLCDAVDAIASESYGAYALSQTPKALAQRAALRDLPAVRARADNDAQADAVVPDLLEEACGALPDELAAVARPLLGLGKWRTAGRNNRHGDAEAVARREELRGEFRHTVRAQIVRAVATELRRINQAAERSRIRDAVQPRVRERIEDQVLAARQRLLHLELELPLLPIRARVYRAPADMPAPGSDLVDDVLDAWVRCTGRSNLAVVLGSFGSGKSASLLRLAERALKPDAYPHMNAVLFSWFSDLLRPSRPTVASSLPGTIADGLASLYFPDLVAERNGLTQMRDELTGCLTVIDGFDDSWTAIRGEARTHLGHLSSIVLPDAKLVLSSRRHLDAQRDPLVAQLRDPVGYPDLGVVDPLILELQPPSYQDLRSALVNCASVDAERVLDYLGSFPAESVVHLFRPLLVEMLLMVRPIHKADPEPLTVSDLYREYTEVVLKRDYNQARSRMEHYVKEHVLRELAGQRLRERPQPDDDPAAPMSSVALQLIVAEAAMTAGLDMTASDVNYTQDFVEHNHFLVARSESWHASDTSFEFSHPTFFEHFAADYLLARMDRGEAFALPDMQQTEALFDSLIPYFLKARLGSQLLPRLRRLARRPQLGDLDRVLTLYLLEDDSAFLQTLDNSPDDYRKFLHVASQRPGGYFLHKAVRYQLLLLSRSTDLAVDYVEFVRVSEDQQRRDLEEKLFSSGSSSEEYLLQRLDNRQLASARPITIYRLGQFGSVAAHRRLKALAVGGSITDPRVAGLLEEALSRLAERSVQGA